MAKWGLIAIILTMVGLLTVWVKYCIVDAWFIPLEPQEKDDWPVTDWPEHHDR